MRTHVTMSVALLLVLAAVAAPAALARGGKTAIDRSACTTTETDERTITILDNGTRLREDHEEKVVDCPGTSNDAHEEESDVDYDEDYDGEPCDSTKTVVKKEYTLTNGTEVVEKKVSETRDCPGSEDDLSETTTTFRYRPAEKDAEPDGDANEEDDDGAPSNRSGGKGHHFGWYDNETKTELKVEWKESDKGNASQGRAHAFGLLDNETKAEMKAEWKSSDKGNSSWFRMVLSKIRG